MIAAAFVSFTVTLYFLFGTAVPHSTIILLPDADGTVGEVIVSNQTGSQTLNTAYTLIEVNDATSKLGKTQKTSLQKIETEFKASLSAKPDEVKTYILYFISGTSELTAESTKILPDIVAEIRARKTYEAYIVGHTDTMGSNKINYGLGLNRANYVGKLIDSYFPDRHSIEVVSYGEGSLLIPTADNVDEPKNRRVEIEVH